MVGGADALVPATTSANGSASVQSSSNIAKSEQFQKKHSND
jgi:hypothetical protein